MGEVVAAADLAEGEAVAEDSAEEGVKNFVAVVILGEEGVDPAEAAILAVDRPQLVVQAGKEVAVPVPVAAAANFVLVAVVSLDGEALAILDVAAQESSDPARFPRVKACRISSISQVPGERARCAQVGPVAKWRDEAQPLSFWITIQAASVLVEVVVASCGQGTTPVPAMVAAASCGLEADYDQGRGAPESVGATTIPTGFPIATNGKIIARIAAIR